MFESYYRNIIFKFLSNIEKGTIILNDDVSKTFGSGRPKVTIEIVSPRFYRRSVIGGDLGFAESYAKSEWFTDNLTDLITILILNKGKLSGLDIGWSFISKIFAISKTLLNVNPCPAWTSKPIDFAYLAAFLILFNSFKASSSFCMLQNFPV